MLLRSLEQLLRTGVSLNKTLLLQPQPRTQSLAINDAVRMGYGDNDRLSLNNCRAARESIPNSMK